LQQVCTRRKDEKDQRNMQLHICCSCQHPKRIILEDMCCGVESKMLAVNHIDDPRSAVQGRAAWALGVATFCYRIFINIRLNGERLQRTCESSDRETIPYAKTLSDGVLGLNKRHSRPKSPVTVRNAEPPPHAEAPALCHGAASCQTRVFVRAGSRKMPVTSL
jgi:hypothetical protein